MIMMSKFAQIAEKNMSNVVVTTGLESKFIVSAECWDQAGDFGDIQFYNQEAPLELTEYAKDVLKAVATPSPFIVFIMYVGSSRVEFIREDETTVVLDVELSVKS